MRLLYFLLLLKVLTAQDFRSYSPSVSFPLRNVLTSINLGTTDLHLPTGRCEDVYDGGLSLILPNLGLRKLYPGIIESTRASCLSLQRNFIDEIVYGTFNRLPNLRYLDLAKNRIPFCDLLHFGSHSVLRTLILDENEPPGDDVSRSVNQADTFLNLQHLYLRKNELRGLGFSLRASFPRLTHLYMSDNYVQTEDFVVDVPPSLTHLHLERNQVYRFGGEAIRNLHSLFLDGNRIKTICCGVCEGFRETLNLRAAWKLQVLSLARNDLVNIDSDAFREACNLTSLNLARNRLRVIHSGTFDGLIVLKDLSLSDNKLTVIPDFRRTFLLTSLSLSKNEIEFVPSGAFTHLSSLKWLFLDGNKISRIDVGALVDLLSLEELNLAENRLNVLPAGWMRPQTGLRKVDVKGNRFSCVGDLNLENAPFLSYIYMQNNFVRTVGVRDFIGLAGDVVVYLENECKIPRNPCYERCDEEERRMRIGGRSG